MIWQHSPERKNKGRNKQAIRLSFEKSPCEQINCPNQFSGNNSKVDIGRTCPKEDESPICFGNIISLRE